MKAMVLAAGHGLRMRPLTLLRAKPVLPVLNRPLLDWTLLRLRQAGVREVVVNLHHLPETVESALGDGRRLGLHIHYSREKTLLGTGGAPRAVRDFFGEEPFLLVNGDVLFEMDLGALAQRHRQSGACATLALRPNPDPATYSPVVSDRRGRICTCRCWPRGLFCRASVPVAPGSTWVVRLSTWRRSCGCCGGGPWLTGRSTSRLVRRYGARFWDRASPSAARHESRTVWPGKRLGSRPEHLSEARSWRAAPRCSKGSAPNG